MARKMKITSDPRNMEDIEPKEKESISIDEFRDLIYNEYRKTKREFPWRETTDPYNILISEIMLQQTQTERVVSKYLEFIETFPDFSTLASAPLDQVLRTWQGLGYNRRAKALRGLAQIVMERFNGQLPDSYEELIGLPGIGPYTAGAICAFAFNRPIVFIETNIRRVFIHYFFPQKDKVDDKEIYPLIENTMDRENPREWYYALMDHGAMMRRGETNPNRRSAHYQRQPPFQGSDRQIRGIILRTILSENELTEEQLVRRMGKTSDRVKYNLDRLVQEGLVMEERKRYLIKKD